MTITIVRPAIHIRSRQNIRTYKGNSAKSRPRGGSGKSKVTEQVLRLFVSSPGDVIPERQRVDLVVERLNSEFEGLVRIETVRWETSYYSAHDTFQKQIPEAANCDVVVAIFRTRLGSKLPATFPTQPSGEPYPSGTAYEVLSAMEWRKT